jgi:hypothetical protein
VNNSQNSPIFSGLTIGAVFVMTALTVTAATTATTTGIAAAKHCE